MRCIITGTTTSASALLCAISRSDSSGSNLRVSTIVVPSSRPRLKWAKPHEWNSGAAMCDVARYCSGILDRNEVAGSSVSGEPRLAPFGVPVVPEVRMIILPVFSGGTGCSVGPVLDQLLERGVLDRVGIVDPAHEALAPRAGVLEQVGELLVEHDRHRLLALDHLGDLRARERGVQVQAVGAQLGVGHGGLHEAAVVAAHDRHAVALLDAGVGQAGGQRVGALVDLLEGQGAQLVDQGGAVRVADRAGDEAGRGAAAPAPQRVADPRELVRPDRAHHARVGQDLHAAQLVGRLAQQALGLLAHCGLSLHFGVHAVDVRFQPREPPPHVLPHLPHRYLLGQRAHDAAGRAVAQPQRDPGAAVLQVAQPPAPALVDAGHARPCQVAVLVQLHDLHQPAHVGRAHVHPHPVARAHRRGRLARRRPAPSGARCRSAAATARCPPASPRRPCAGPPRPRAPRRACVPAYPITGNVRSAWSAVSVSCIWSITSA